MFYFQLWNSWIFRGAASQYPALPVCLPACLPACLSFQLALFTLETSTEARVAPGFMEQVSTCILYVF